MTREERLLVAKRSAEWTGPNTWGWANGYRMSLYEAIERSEFG